MAKEDFGSGKYPDEFRYPAPDTAIPEGVSYEDDLLRYANIGDDSAKKILREWEFDDLFQTIFQFTSGGLAHFPYQSMVFKTSRTPLMRHLRDATMSLEESGANKTVGTWEENVLKFLNEIGFSSDEIRLKMGVMAQSIFLTDKQKKLFDDAASSMGMHSIFGVDDEAL